MENPPSVKEFAQALTLLCAPEFGLTEELKIVYECLLCPSNMTEIVSIVTMFCNAFFDPLEQVRTIYNAEQFGESDARFLEIMIPRCLILCDAPKPFFFILTCAFVINIIYQMFDRLECYRFVVTASKCISALIERKFKFFFEDIGQWNILLFYSENVMEKFYAEEEKPCFVDFLLSKGKLKDYISNLIDSCTSMIGTEHVLSEYELALLSDEDTMEEKSEKKAKRLKTEEILNEQINYSSLDSVKNDKKLESTQTLSDQSSKIVDGVLDLSQNNKAFALNNESTLASTSVQSSFTQNLVCVPTTITEHINYKIFNDSPDIDTSKNISKQSFEEKYAGCIFENDAEYRKKVKYAESLEQDPGRFLQGPCFTKLHKRACKWCGLKCFKFLVFCLERHRNRYGDDRTIADAWLELYSDE